MKLHRPLVQAVAETLFQIFEKGMYADKAVEQALKQNPRWGARDRRFIAENIYEIVRWYRKLAFVLNEQNDGQPNYYLKLFAVHQILKGTELPPWVEFSSLDKTSILAKNEDAKQTRKYRESIPDWLDETGVRELGERIWEKEVHELNNEAQVVLRVNTLKISPEKLYHSLLEKGLAPKPIHNTSPLWEEIKSGAFVLPRQNLQKLDEYKQGLFEIQDASSQLIAPFLQVKEGMTIIDACAGAGGKSLHIAAMMHNKGKIISMDVEERKLIELKKRADRAGVSIIQTRLISDSAIATLKNAADRLLLDVPCSGLGVLKRNPDAKWKLNPEFIAQIKTTQQHIISNYSQMLKPGGIMVYATCSILPSENQNQVEQFLKQHEGCYTLLADKKIIPSDGFDGFYMAALMKVR